MKLSASDSDLVRKVIETAVARCIADGVVGSERFATDASLIQADANKQNFMPKEQWSSEAIERCCHANRRAQRRAF